MSNNTSSADVDAFMLAANKAAMQAALNLGTAALADSTDFATAAQGGKADTAVQPADLDSYSPKAGSSSLTTFSGGTFGSAAASAAGAFATAAQGSKADTAVQPGDTIAVAHGGTGQTTAQAAINALLAASGAMSQGDVFYFDGTNVVRLAAGTAGKILQTNGAVANPTWESPIWRESLALSDLTTALVASGSIVVGTYTFMESRTLSTVNLAVLTAATGSVLQVDIKKNGTTIFSTKPTIDASEFSTLTAATAGVLSTTSFAAGDVLTIFITQVGSTIAGAGLQVYLKGTF